jgi:hypothetical protein
MCEFEKNEVERVYEELLFLREHLESSSAEPTILNTLSSVDAKVMLLCSASYFERTICDGILIAFSRSASQNIMISFLENHALNRKYHTLFNWNDNNANSFFGLFGEDFKKHMKKILNDEQQKYMRDFLEIGRERNKLVHNNYATFNLNYTAKEIYEKFSTANKFVTVILSELSNFSTASQKMSDETEQGNN